MRILTVRIGRAGDMVMITPALKALLECYADAKFTILTSPDGYRLLRNYNSAIEDIWVWNRSAFGSALKKFDLRKKIVEGHFDKIICFETSRSIIDMLSNASTEFYWQSGYDEVLHSARYYLNLVEKVCSKKFDDIAVNLPVTTESSDLINQELATAGITKDDVIVALHPTFSGYSRFNLRKRNARKHKLWPAEYFGQLAEQLKDTSLNNGKPPKIVIDLLDDEMPLGGKIAKFSNNSIILLNAKPNIDRYKAFLKRANLLVSPDTGPMHIAAAVGTRIVALFSGKDPALCGPYMDPGMFTVLTSNSMPNPNMGISAISVEAALNACLEQLDKIKLDSSTGTKKSKPR